MRRLVLPVIMAFGLVMIGSSGAFADDPAPVVSAPATPGKKLCKIADSDLDELSGMVATKSGYVVINDSSNDTAHKKVFFLNTKCQVTSRIAFSGAGPSDTEDMVLSPDGKTLWIADTGDNQYADENDRRPSIALWSMPLDHSTKPVLHRLSYPQGDYHDAEALLLNGDGTPLIVTKEVAKPAYIYQPTGPLQKNNEEGVPLKRVGEITVSGTTTSGPPIARIGNKTITGGAILAGGTKVALRTYTDALEWDVKNGDVLGALKGKPRTTGLPDEKQGEAITYSADGKSFLTVSDMSGDAKTANYILSYTPATKVAEAAKGTAAGDGKKWYDGLSIGDIKAALGGVGVLGLILVGVGVFGITQFRKKHPRMPEPAPDGLESPLNGDPETELIGVGGSAPRTAGVYGGAGAAGAPGAAAAAAGAARSGPVYGSGGSGATAGQRGGGAPVYGRPNGQQPARSGGGGGGGGPQAPARGPQGQPPARAPQGQPPARGPQGQPPRGPQGQPARAPQGQPPARGPQGQPQRGPQGQPARAPQPPRGPQGQPARAPQPPRGPQGQPPARGPQGQPPRGPQGQPPRGPQGQPARGPQGQPPRGPQGQPPRGPQGQAGPGGEGGPGGGGVYGQGPRGDGYSDYNPRREDRYDPGYGRR